MTADIEKLAGLIRSARRTVVFTGAGMSTESGIPDFRSPGGIWLVSVRWLAGLPAMKAPPWM